MGKLAVISGATLERNNGILFFSQPPALTDMAVGMGRAARFAGQTNHWWSVLHHIYSGYAAMRADGRTLESAALKGWWVHDAHEAFTADIPSPVKAQETKDLQHNIDSLLVGDITGWPNPKGRAQDAVAEMDARMLRAEAYALCPPREPGDFIEIYGGLPNMNDVRIVQGVQQMYATGLSSTEGWNSPLVRWWVGRMRRVLIQPGAWNSDDSEELDLLQRMVDKQTAAYGDLHEEEE